MPTDRLFRETPCLECGQSGPHTPFSNPWYSHPNEGGSREEFNPNIEAAIASVFAQDGAGLPGQEWPIEMYPSDIARAVVAAFTPGATDEG